MRLLSLKLSGFRRLDGLSLNLDSRLIAIVGPNEAGKSSLLEALAKLDTDDALSPQDSTHGMTVAANGVVVDAMYLLDEEDRRALAGIPEAREARYFIFQRRADGSFGADVRPTPERDLTLRQTVTTKVARAAAFRGIQEARLNDEALDEAFVAGAAVLASEAQSLSEGERLALEALADGLSGESATPTTTRTAEVIRELVEHESRRHPRTAAREAMSPRRPTAVLFTNADRRLRDEYDVDDFRADPPRALANLAAVAGLDLAELVRATDDAHHARKESLVRDANVRLTEAFADAWRQFAVSVQVSMDGRTLRVFASGEGNEVTSVAERSDGLKAFISLLAFLSVAGREVPPVLLIDEAEQHLHYDAQADLVRMLTRQQLARQVIYTTHSAGCLPEDFGAAVRVIAPAAEGVRSEARNGFWESASAGFDSLLFAMGASTFAFAAARRAVIAEGPTEVILLPRLMREATGENAVGFQVAPGLATVDRAGAADLDMVAARVAYVVDNDSGGRAIRKTLRKSGVPDERIVSVAMKGRETNALEDLLDAEQYLAAVNELLRRSHGGKVVLSPSHVAGASRVAAVTEACDAQGVRPPNKTAVARLLAERESDVPLLTKAGAAALRSAHAALAALLNASHASTPSDLGASVRR